MKKLLLKTWLLLACLLLGVGTSWAEEAVYKTALFGSSYNSKGVSSYTGSFSATNNEFTVDLENFNNNNNGWEYVKTGNKTNAAVGTITTNSAIDKAITKVTVTIDAVTSTSVNSITLYSGTSASACTTSEGTFTISTGAQSVSISSPAENKFYKISFDCKKGSSNGLVQVSKVEYSYNKPSDEGGSTTPTVTAPTFDVTAGTYTEDQLVLIDNYNSDYLYAYTLDGTDPAFDENLDVTSGTAYDNNEGIEITSSCTLKAIAVDEDGNASSISSAVYTINKPQVFASLEDLVAADITTGTTVTVSFENVPIKSIFTTAQGYRNGVYFDIQKGGKDIEIYYQNVPEEWVAGGTLSGTMTCPWKLYNGTWELAPDKDTWAWTNLTYIKKTITALAVSGTPTKTTYNVGDAFETAGLVVTATYSDNTQAPITDGFEWEIDYGKTGEVANTAFVAGATSVDVMVSTEDNVMSDVYTVNGLTVNVPVTLTSIAVSGTPTKTEYYAGDAFETAGLVVTGTYSDSHQETITEGIDWTIDPETLTLGITSVDVMAGVGSVVSDVYTVEGLTVNKPDFETVTYNFSEFTSGQSVELTDLDGFVITLVKGTGGSNPSWVASASEARLYATGSLTVKANNATIKSIEYTYVVNANKSGNVPTIDSVEGTTNPGTWDEGTKTWTGADEEVTFSTSGAAGNIGFTKLVIKYVEGTKIKTSLAWSNTEAEVTIGAEDNVFPTLTTTPADLSGVTYESSNTAVATIAADGSVTLVKAGETTITASYAGDEEHAAATPVSYTLTVNDAPFVPVPAEDGYESVDLAALYSNVTTNATVADYEGTSFALAFAKPQSSNTPTKYYDNGKAVRAYIGNTITITAAENIKNVFVDYVPDNYDDAATITGLDTKTAVITFSQTCRFYGITVNYTVNTVDLVAEEDGTYYATFSSNETVYFSSDADVNTVDVKNGEMTVTPVVNNIVPASTGVLLSTTSATASYYRAASHTESLSDNMLKPASEAMTGDYKFYKLAYNDYAEKTGLGFYYGAADGAAFTAKTGGAYLAVPTSAGAREGFAFDESTGIESVETEAQATTIYTINGVKVSEMGKGLFIQNGKKIMVK